MKKRMWLLALITSILCMGTSFVVMAEDNDDDVSSQQNYSNGTLYISDATELVSFASQVNAGTISGQVDVVLTANIDLTGTEFSSIEGGISGTFDGGNYTITLDGDSLFIEIDSMTITNLKLDGTVTVASGNAASLAQIATGSTITNVTNYATVTSQGSSESYGVGGIVGYCGQNTGSNSSAVTISNCENKGSIVSYGSPVGGIVGYSSTAIFNNCTNSGIVVQYGGSNTFAGGIIGEFVDSNDNNVSDHVVSCSNSGSITNSNGNAGGIAGYANGQEIDDCSNTGSVAGNVAGGILGLAGTSTTAVTYVTDCSNTGAISGYTSAAGIIGQSTNANITVDSNSTVDTAATVALSAIEDLTAEWKTGDIRIDLTEYTTNTSGIGGYYSLSDDASSAISIDGSTLVISNDSTAMNVGTYTITVYFTVNSTTKNSTVSVTITPKNFIIGDFKFNNISITSDNLADLTASVTYDGTWDSLEKDISTDIWSDDYYSVTYAFDSNAWIVTMSITPDLEATNIASSATSMTYQYAVVKRALVEEVLTIATSYTFPVDLVGEQTTVTKDGQTDGCVYESDITFYTSEAGEYTYSVYSEVVE